MKCQSCGKTVAKKTKFCPSCGEPIVHRRSDAPQAHPRRSIPLSYALAFIAGGAIIGFLYFKFSSTPTPPQMVVGGGFQGASGSVQAVAIPAALRPQVQEIASEFMCPCGGCDDLLSECVCEMKNGALEVKQFIAQQLQSGAPKPQIVAAVTQRYGHYQGGSGPNVDFKGLQ